MRTTRSKQSLTRSGSAYLSQQKSLPIEQIERKATKEKKNSTKIQLKSIRTQPTEIADNGKTSNKQVQSRPNQRSTQNTDKQQESKRQEPLQKKSLSPIDTSEQSMHQSEFMSEDDSLQQEDHSQGKENPLDQQQSSGKQSNGKRKSEISSDDEKQFSDEETQLTDKNKKRDDFCANYASNFTTFNYMVVFWLALRNSENYKISERIEYIINPALSHQNNIVMRKICENRMDQVAEIFDSGILKYLASFGTIKDMIEGFVKNVKSNNWNQWNNLYNQDCQEFKVVKYAIISLLMIPENISKEAENDLLSVISTQNKKLNNLEILMSSVLHIRLNIFKSTVPIAQRNCLFTKSRARLVSVILGHLKHQLDNYQNLDSNQLIRKTFNILRFLTHHIVGSHENSSQKQQQNMNTAHTIKWCSKLLKSLCLKDSLIDFVQVLENFVEDQTHMKKMKKLVNETFNHNDEWKLMSDILAIPLQKNGYINIDKVNLMKNITHKYFELQKTQNKSESATNDESESATNDESDESKNDESDESKTDESDESKNNDSDESKNNDSDESKNNDSDSSSTSQHSST